MKVNNTARSAKRSKSPESQFADGVHMKYLFMICLCKSKTHAYVW
jgi:hypothetical protein